MLGEVDAVNGQGGVGGRLSECDFVSSSSSGQEEALECIAGAAWGLQRHHTLANQPPAGPATHPIPTHSTAAAIPVQLLPGGARAGRHGSGYS